ncbi:3-oxoacyl-(acyl-carrier-protein) synthase III [Streptomyces sp. V4I8]|uniref:3-oxoacyl-ACP synthase III family protein n=1 Tax=Streptomyces sp. V4I8 TaxID=3156469 RepID=UPI003511F81F
MTASNIGIIGTGSYLPKRKVTNAQIAARIGIAEQLIEDKTLIRTRRFAEDHEAASDLAVRAARAALAQARLTTDRVTFLIVSTSTGDFAVPPTSYLVQDALGASKASCFDVNAACAGFVYGLGIARSLVTTSPGSYALVIASDVYSRFTNPQDRTTAVVLADGAGAAVLGPTAGPGIHDVELRSSGEAHAFIRIPAGGSRKPASTDTLASDEHTLRMQGRPVTDFVLATVPVLLQQLVKRNGYTMDDIKHFIPHQANGVMVRRLAEETQLTQAKTHLTVQTYGNSGSASVPVTLDHAASTGALEHGDLILLTAFGSGMASGACLLTWEGKTH